MRILNDFTDNSASCITSSSRVTTAATRTLNRRNSRRSCGDRKRIRRTMSNAASFLLITLTTTMTTKNRNNGIRNSIGIIKFVSGWSNGNTNRNILTGVVTTTKQHQLSSSSSSVQLQKSYLCNSNIQRNIFYHHDSKRRSQKYMTSSQLLHLYPSWIQNHLPLSLTTTTTTFTRTATTKRFSKRIKKYRPSKARIASSKNNDENNNESKSDDSNTKKRKKYENPKSKKIRIAEEITQANIDKLSAAFDALARKEGFDTSTSYFADGATFEDDFNYDDDVDEDFDDDDNNDDLDDLDDDDNSIDGFGDDNPSIDQKDKKQQLVGDTNENIDALLDPSQFRLSDFVGVDDNNNNNNKITIKDDNVSLRNNVVNDDDDDDMDSRIAAARRDLNMGRVVVPKQLDRYAEEKKFDLSSLGFREEEDPWGNDEGPRSRHEKKKKEYQLVLNAMVCQACGADFQCSKESRPGYLPPEKFDIQVKLSKLEELERLQGKAESKDAEWTPEDEVEWLIQSASNSNNDVRQSGTSSTEAAASIDIAATAEEMGLDLDELAKKRTICKRCHGLQNFGKVDEVLRPGWTEEPMLSQEKFRDLLRPIREKPAVIIALVDLFDFAGSVLPELDSIAGDNPVIIAANKVDLLPAKMGQQRAENWVRRELEYLGVRSLANIGGAVRLVSCKTGAGVQAMLDKARKLADEMDCDIYVVGAANAGKSTLLNYILGPENDPYEDGTAKLRAGNINKRKSSVTTSPLPGTTLKFIQVNIGGGRSLYDTPGLLVPGTLTQLLTPEELKIVIPKSNVEPITLRIAAGKVVLVGGLAKIELVGDSRPFLFTFFVANGIKLHPTDSSKADEFIKKNVGEMLIPPLGGLERLNQLGEFESHIIDVEGAGWKEAAADISLTGLGWIAVTGAGVASVKVSVPKGVVVSLRPPLMPFDIWESTARYTGSRAVRKTTKTKYGKKRKGVGRN